MTAALLIIAYLLGSINFAIIICKLAKLPDPRSQSSGNPGATNVLRYGGKNLALLVILGDALKGFIPVIIAKMIHVDSFMLGTVVLVSVLGHIFPIFFRFQGGKGIATTFGAMIAFSWPIGAAILATWILIALIFRFSSLASIISVAAMPVFVYFFQGKHGILPIILLTLIILYRHRGNLFRLYHGEESKINLRK